MSEINNQEPVQSSSTNPAPVGSNLGSIGPAHVHHYLRNYGLALLVLTAILVFIFWFFQYTGRPLIKVGGENDLLSGKYKVEDVEPQAFGSLSMAGQVPAPESVAALNDASQSVNTQSDDQKMMAPGVGGGMGIMPPMEYFNYKFKYVGGDLPVLGEQQEVYRLVSPSKNQGFIDSLVRVMSVGLIDLQKMRGGRVDYITFSEERPQGYTFNLDMKLGFISVGQNWEFWPQLPTVCDQNYCGPVPRLKPEDLFSEDQAIAIAEKFFSDYNISREGLAKPYLDRNTGGIVRPMDTSVYIPDQQSVIYPKMIEGRTVYNESGQPEGLQVSIDVRQKAVIGVYGISRNQYQRSLYKGVQDSKKIIDVVNRGGFRNYVYEDPNAKEVTLEIDTPTTAVVSMWYSAPGSSYSEQIYVNSLLFPIKDSGKNNYWREYLIVPLVQDILDSDQQVPPIMPFVKEGVPAEGTVEIMPAPMPEVMPSM